MRGICYFPSSIAYNLSSYMIYIMVIINEKKSTIEDKIATQGAPLYPKPEQCIGRTDAL